MNLVLSKTKYIRIRKQLVLRKTTIQKQYIILLSLFFTHMENSMEIHF